MDSKKELEEELKKLRNERKEKEDIKKLKKQIKEERFNNSKLGKLIKWVQK